jgi:hemoglobin
MHALRKNLFAAIAALCFAAPSTGFAQDASARTAAASLYHALGEMDGIKSIVDRLLKTVVADERIGKVFEGADMPHLAMRLSEQFCALSDGPCKYAGKDMTTIHEDMAITNAQFNALVEDLQAAMESRGIPSRVQNRLLAKLAPMQKQIVTK